MNIFLMPFVKCALAATITLPVTRVADSIARMPAGVTAVLGDDSTAFMLVFARGAGAAAMRGIGISTACGMLAATFVGIVFVPALYAVFQRMSEWGGGRGGR